MYPIRQFDIFLNKCSNIKSLHTFCFASIIESSGGMIEWLTRQASNDLVAWVQTPSGASRCLLGQETLLSLLSSGWFQERIRKCL
jgi:hypothetical protein